MFVTCSTIQFGFFFMVLITPNVRQCRGEHTCKVIAKSGLINWQTTKLIKINVFKKQRPRLI